MNAKNSTNILQLFEEKSLLTVCAPMVRYSKLQFRTLVREYNCHLCYTPMILADSFCQSEKARHNEFSTNLGDSPLIVQFAANSVHDFVGAAYMVHPYCDGVDLNCGCPQTWAKQMGIGCSLMNKPELISDIVHQCRNRINKPFTVSVKLRLLKDIRQTVEICRSLEKAGVSFLAVHARTPSQNSGSINIDGLKIVTDSLKCPVIGNGGVKNLVDCKNLQNYTNCKGVMVSNSILTNPSLFAGSNFTPLDCVQKWLNICYNSTLSEYPVNKTIVNIPKRPPNITFQCFHHHLVFMLEKILPKSERRIFNNLQSFETVLQFLDERLNLRPNLYSYEMFKNMENLYLDYVNRDVIYSNLKSRHFNENGLSGAANTVANYNFDDSNGHFFKSKCVSDESIECSLENVFI